MSNLEQKIEKIFSKWQEGICPGGQVVVRKQGYILYQNNFGYANIEQEVPVTDRTVFHVASVSKQVTVMAILLLQEDGKLTIEDDIREYVPEYIQFQEPLTIRQLMNNVSGIRDQWELLGLSGVRIVDTITQRDALSIIGKQQQLNFSPQSQFLYSNSNFTLLAEIVERLSGTSFDEFTTKRIFRPLGMKQTCFKDSYWKVIPRRADSYYDDGNGNFAASVLNYGTYGATSLNTTATDFLKWMDNYKNPVICSNETLQIMWETRPFTDGTENSYAGGLFVGEHRGRNYFEHGGADAAFRSAMIRFPEEGVDIVLFANTQNMLMKDTALAVADAVFGDDREEFASQTEHVPDEYMEEVDVATVEGVYFPVKGTPFMRFDIEVKGGWPHLKHPYGTAPLKLISQNHYKIDSLSIDLFLGKKTGMKWNGKLVELKKLTSYPAEQGMQWQGCYESSELETTYRVIEKDGILHLSHDRHGDEILYHLEGSSFIVNAPFTFQVEFFEEAGEVTGFEFHGGRVKNVKLTKKK